MTPELFPAFLGEVTGHGPFPWQQRLVEEVYESGRWPSVLDIPTGCGKTTALEAAVFLLASDAQRPPRERRFPRRIFLVIDRRVVVDQAGERANALARRLWTATRDEVPTTWRVAEALRSLSDSGVPLVPAVLRGGILRNEAWARSADQPVLGVSTVDQVGARLLFRGYGVSQRMAPVHAGLLGQDCLFLLDEVHLSQPFAETLRALDERWLGWAERPLDRPWQVAALSATPGTNGDTPETMRLGLDEADRRHPVIERRLSSYKPAALRMTKAGRDKDAAAARAFADAARELLKKARTVAVIVNRVHTAQAVRDALAERAIDTLLLTGRMRPADRDALLAEKTARIGLGRTRRDDDPPLVVVATQCIEAGADLDFDALVTECASLDALKQRFGRLDRAGELTERHGSAPAIIVARREQVTGKATDDPVYGGALRATWERLNELAEPNDTAEPSIDLGLAAAPTLDDVALLAPRPRAPHILPAHLDAWCQTAPRPALDPDVSQWLHGPERTTRDVHVLWRGDVTAELLQNDSSDLVARLSVARPGAAEALAVPLPAVQAWLCGERPVPVADVEGSAEEGERSQNAPPENDALPALRWRGDESDVVTDPATLRPGDTLVVPGSYGGLAAGCWAPDSNAPVSDLGDQLQCTQQLRASLRLLPEVLGPDVPTPPRPAAGRSEEEERDLLRAWLDDVAGADVSGDVAGWLRSAAAELSELLAKRGAVSIRRWEMAGAPFYQLTRRGPTRPLRFWQTGSARPRLREVPLREHLAGVARRVRAAADRCGLDEVLGATLEAAGQLHDVGKLDPRFQRMLYGGDEIRAALGDEPLAKSKLPLDDRALRDNARQRAGLPKGTRHELTSLALIDAAATDGGSEDSQVDGELLRYLVASHHGHCRPLAPVVDDPAPVRVTWDGPGGTVNASSDHGLARLDSGVAERFWRLVQRYGWHGLAWLESLLRLADHAQSASEQLAEEGGAA